ncbi:hypothetical protein [Roseateles sp. LKC17W]|uniref:Uncharacterized protein n=1 Tax=Pelomonas margarita TaxID=3299031 RepID=A0ABW7FNU6_9BURK
MVTRGVFRSNFLIVMLAGGAYTQALAQSSTGTPATPSTESSTAAAYQRLKANLYEAKKALFKAEEVVSPKANSLRQEMQILFKEFDCQLPAAVQERIKATNPSGYIPPDLDSKLFPPHVEQLKYTAINGQSAAAALASVQFAPTAPAMLPTSVRLKSSSIYAKLNPFGLIDKSSDAVIYTMDCSGYLTSTFNLGLR